MGDRFYVLPQDIKDGRAYLGAAEAHHIINVMRLAEGDRIVIFDGTGKEYIGFIEKAALKQVVMKIERVRETEKKVALKITLVQAIPKKVKMDYIVAKCTELGIDRIVPVITERTITRLDKGQAKLRRRRWEKIAIQAAKQSGRSTLPSIEEVKQLHQVLSAAQSYQLALMPSLSREAHDLRVILRKKTNAQKVIVFIGPEGGFSPDEENSAQQAGCMLVSLGPRTLRADTAPIVTVSILNYELGQK